MSEPAARERSCLDGSTLHLPRWRSPRNAPGSSECSLGWGSGRSCGRL